VRAVSDRRVFYDAQYRMVSARATARGMAEDAVRDRAWRVIA
jgi:hypothetical protein